MAGVREKEKTRADYTQHKYIVCFIERDGVGWWDWVFRTRLGFRHCFVAQWCEWSQRWIMVDWRQARTDFTIFFDFEMEAILRTMHAVHGTVVEITPIELNEESGGLITYCSNIIGRFMGLGNSVLLTPYGLYRKLLAAGGEVVYSWRDEE